MYKTKKGFTLIELLVVISIISLLASIIFSSLGEAREKSKRAAGQQFDGQLYRSMSDNSALLWNFDEPGTTGDALDESGSAAKGYFNGDATRDRTDKPLARGAAVKFNGTGYISTTPSVGSGMNPVSLLPYVGATTPEFTVSFWVKKTAGASQAGPNVRLVDGMTAVAANSPFAIITNQAMTNIFIYGGSCGWNTTLPITYLVKDTWQHITVTHKSNLFKAYIDGKEAGTSATCVTGTTLSSVVVGKYWNGTSDFLKGSIDELYIYRKALAAAEIEAIYAKGAAEHGLAVK